MTIAGESWSPPMTATEVRARQEASRAAVESAFERAKASMLSASAVTYGATVMPSVPYGVTSVTSPSTGSYTINLGDEASGMVLSQITEAFLATLTSDEIVDLGMKITNELTRREEANDD